MFFLCVCNHAYTVAAKAYPWVKPSLVGNEEGLGSSSGHPKAAVGENKQNKEKFGCEKVLDSQP